GGSQPSEPQGMDSEGGAGPNPARLPDVAPPVPREPPVMASSLACPKRTTTVIVRPSTRKDRLPETLDRPPWPVARPPKTIAPPPRSTITPRPPGTADRPPWPVARLKKATAMLRIPTDRPPWGIHRPPGPQTWPPPTMTIRRTAIGASATKQKRDKWTAAVRIDRRRPPTIPRTPTERPATILRRRRHSEGGAGVQSHRLTTIEPVSRSPACVGRRPRRLDSEGGARRRDAGLPAEQKGRARVPVNVTVRQAPVRPKGSDRQSAVRTTDETSRAPRVAVPAIHLTTTTDRGQEWDDHPPALNESATRESAGQQDEPRLRNIAEERPGRAGERGPATTRTRRRTSAIFATWRPT